MYSRDAGDITGSTTRCARPDLVVWLAGKLLVLKGEEKAIQTDFAKARTELTSKMADVVDPSQTGMLPYILCYAAAGDMLQFFAVPTAGDKMAVPISDGFWLSKAADRARVATCVINIVRILQAMDPYAQQASPLPPIYSKIITSASTITVFGDHVKKRTKAFSSPDILELYQLIRTAGPMPFLVTPARWKIVGISLVCDRIRRGVNSKASIG